MEYNTIKTLAKRFCTTEEVIYLASLHGIKDIENVKGYQRVELPKHLIRKEVLDKISEYGFDPKEVEKIECHCFDYQSFTIVDFGNLRIAYNEEQLKVK